jgi:hypothetical protein
VGPPLHTIPPKMTELADRISRRVEIILPVLLSAPAFSML